MTLIAVAALVFSAALALVVSRQAKSTNLQENVSRLPMRTALKFAIASAIWILLSDLALTAWASNPAMVRILEIAKGWA
jgi:flagellar biosynthesis component FlhA